jgi:hypothetical protein
MKYSSRLPVAVLTAAALAAACSSTEPSRCEDTAAVDAVLHESGRTVTDTTGARLVMEDYIAHVISSGEPFPDGADFWVLERVAQSPWDVAPWVAFYVPQPGDPFTSQVYVDRDGRVVRLTIAVHAPCGP